MLEIVAGWDDREIVGYQLCQFSAMRRTSEPLRFVPLMEKPLRYQGLYSRQHELRGGQLWDVISDAPMATAFACSRFLTPWLGSEQWVLFADFADMLFLGDPAELFAHADDQYAVMVVKRDHKPHEGVKMDGQVQTTYARKNWSSVILWNRDHPANTRLTLEMVNMRPGRDLHAFCWLEDDEIGDLPFAWNHLVGVDASDQPAKLLHFTLGTPELGKHYDGWSDIWLREFAIFDAASRHLRAV